LPPFRTMNLAISRSALRRLYADTESTAREKTPGLLPVRPEGLAGAEKKVRMRTKGRLTTGDLHKPVFVGSEALPLVCCCPQDGRCCSGAEVRSAQVTYASASWNELKTPTSDGFCRRFRQTASVRG
jgi:hypothetical protein